jgi:hypothetical protein
MKLPGAVIFINNQINNITQKTLEDQLFITETLDNIEFDGYVSEDGYYLKNIHQNHLRILVIRDDYSSHINWDYADVVLTINQGLAYVELNKIGPPSNTFPINRLTIYDLLKSIGTDLKVKIV